MAISLVQFANNGNNGGTSLSVFFLSNTTSGNCILVGVGSANPGETITSVTDAASNTYTFVSGTHATNSSSYTCEFWVAKNIVGGFKQVTANYSGGGTTKVIFVMEYSGVSTTTPTGVVGVLNNQGPGNPTSPSLTITNSSSALVAFVVGRTIFSSVNSPWTFVDSNSVWATADIIPGTSGTFQATFNPSDPITWGSSGVELLTPGTTLTLTLTDSISFSDSIVEEDDKTITDSITASDTIAKTAEHPVSDSTTINDTFPNSFSLQSSAIVPVSIPVVEILTNAEIPAEVKTFYRFE